MSDDAFFNLLILLMEADPWPFNADRVVIEQFLDSEANKRGYADWIEAYHMPFPVSRATSAPTEGGGDASGEG